MTKPFEIVGDLHLECQEGGFASDAFVIRDPNPRQDLVTQLVEIVTNLHPNGREVDDLVAEHFGCERERPSGDRHIGMVRIIIEKLPENEDV